jgi:hypothetical protein
MMEDRESQRVIAVSRMGDAQIVIQREAPAPGLATCNESQGHWLHMYEGQLALAFARVT